MTTGVKIKLLRKNLGFTQSQLADGLCTKAFISQIESGKREPNDAMFRSLSNRLKVPVFWLKNDRDNDMKELNRLFDQQTLTEGEICYLRLHMYLDHSYEILMQLFTNLLHRDRLKRDKENGDKVYKRTSEVIDTRNIRSSYIYTEFEIACGKYLYHFQYFQAADLHYTNALENIQKDDIYNLAELHYVKSLTQQRLDDRITTALQLSEKSLSLFQTLKDWENVERVLLGRFTQLCLNNGLSQAESCLKQAKHLSETNDKRIYLPLIYYNFGLLYLKQKQYDRSSEYLDKSLRLYKTRNEKRSIAYVYSEFMELAILQENDDQVNQFFKKALVTAQNAQMPYLSMMTRATFVQYQQRSISTHDYISQMERIQNEAEEANYPTIAKKLAIKISNKYNLTGNIKRANLYLEKAIKNETGQDKTDVIIDRI